jgi:hypothetical protein
MMLKVSSLLSRHGIARVGGGGGATLRSSTTTQMSSMMSTMTKPGSSLGESIPEEWLGPDVETHGEWEGCSLGMRNDNGVAKFLAPISTSSRGVGELF